MRPRARRRVAETRAWAADVVRSALGDAEQVRQLVADAVAADHPALPPLDTADAWIAEAALAWREDAATWPPVTDHDRLREAFADLERRGIVVLAGCEDHWQARDAARADPPPRGIAWFTPPDVWHAISDGMLEVNLWHGTTANAAPGDALLEEALMAFADAGLEAVFDEGRIEVSAWWRARPGARA